MSRWMGRVARIACGVAFLFAQPITSDARDRAGGYLDLGVGPLKTQPYVTSGVPSGTVGVGASAGWIGPFRACFDFRATAGEDIAQGTPESANGGKQSLVTFLLGLELESRRSLQGPFFTAGLGIGHSTISGARGPTDSPNYGFVPLEDRTAMAYGLGVGYRISAGPGPLLTHIALRNHGVFADGFSAFAYATVFTVGLTY